MNYLLKMAAAFIGAALLVNGLCYFYYSPAVQTDNPDKYTEAKSEPSAHNPHLPAPPPGSDHRQSCSRIHRSRNT